MVCCGAAARARDRALFAAAADAIHTRQLTCSCALFSLSQLKQVLAASKTLASKPHEGRTALGVSEDLSLAATSFVSFVVYVLLLDLTSASQRLARILGSHCTLSIERAAAPRSPFYGIGELRDRRTLDSST